MCLAACGGLAAVSHWIPQINPPDEEKNLVFEVSKVDVESFHHHHYPLRRGVRASKFERCELVFDVDIDLRDEFHWNTKQLFVWLSVDYVGKNSKTVHRSSLWDELVVTQSQAMFELEAKVPEYKLVGPDLDLRDNNVNFTLNWDIHPWIGLVTRKHSQTPLVYKMPVRYSTK